MAYIASVSTSALTNQNISSALLAHTFTNTTRKRKVYVSVDLQQIAGNGDYVVYLTIQRAGAGSAYRTQSTTFAVPSGVTVATFESIALIVGATDVVKVYVVGLAGDTTTPDITTYVDEEYVITGGNGGTLTLTYTVSSSAGGVVAGATVELYAEVGMSTLIDSQVTDVLGVATFNNLVAGTYYLKIIRSGYTTATDSEVVS